MSFAYGLKDEICSNRSFTARHRIAQAYGLFLFSQRFNTEGVEIRTEHPEVAKLYRSMVYKLTGTRPSTIQREHIKTGSDIYIVSVDEPEDRIKLLTLYGKHTDEANDIKPEYFSEREGINAFIGGAFLACGNVSDPEKGYHLEFSVAEQGLAEELQKLLLGIGMEAKLSTRRGQAVVYLKDSTKIEEIITLMGAAKATLSLMDTKIVKELRNNINRVNNCEAANIEKTAAAAIQQIQQIQTIMDSGKFGTLSPELKELAMLRVENPEMSLRELGEALQVPLSRSGVNHRLRRLCEIAERLKTGE